MTTEIPKQPTWLIKDIAEELGITKDGVLKIARGKLDLGEKIAGMWWFTDEDLQLIKNNCRKYLLNNR